jgi:hypothetical protein
MEETQHPQPSALPMIMFFYICTLVYTYTLMLYVHAPKCQTLVLFFWNTGHKITYHLNLVLPYRVIYFDSAAVWKH